MLEAKISFMQLENFSVLRYSLPMPNNKSDPTSVSIPNWNIRLLLLRTPMNKYLFFTLVLLI